MKLLLVCALFVAGASAADGKRYWGYDELHGPANWASLSAKCSGSSQSPIDIDISNKEEVLYDENLTNDLDFIIANTDEDFYIVNNAHTVYTDTMSADITMTGLQLGAAYKVAGPHFHWGSDSSRGSEHTLGGKQYPLEMHIVMYNEEKYGTLKDAVMSGQPGALAVIGVFFEVSNEDNPALAPIVGQLENVIKGDKTRHQVKAFSLTDILPASTAEYFRYQGSLTTPNCEEVVTWTVMANPQPVSEAQLAKFRALKGLDTEDNDIPLVDNWRPTQPLNGRTISRSFIDPNIRPQPREGPAKKTAGAVSGTDAENSSTNVIAALSTVIATVICALVL